MTVTPTIRAALPDEAEALLALWREADAAPSVSDDVESIRRLIARDPDALLVAEEDGRLVASLIVGWDGWRAGLYRLAVAPAHRRRGVASALVEAAEDRLRVLGARKVAANVIAEHDHAVGFWAAGGYEHEERVGRWTKRLG